MAYANYADNSELMVYLSLMCRVAELSHAAANKDAIFWLQLGRRTGMNAKVLYQFTKNGLWTLVNEIIWVKSGTFPQKDGSEASFGQFRPVTSNKKLHSCWEMVYMLVRTEDLKDIILDKKALGVPYEDKTNLKRFSHNADLRCRGDMWFVPYETKIKTGHPCPFPVKLAENCIKLQGLKPGSNVADLFMGSGSTLVACKNLKMMGFGMEISKDYCKIARNRLDDYVTCQV